MGGTILKKEPWAMMTAAMALMSESSAPAGYRN
jgi:hypothetical protein